MFIWVFYGIVELIMDSLYGFGSSADGTRKHVIAFELMFAFVVICVALPMNVYAVGGISNSKVVVPNTETIAHKRIQLAPFFEIEFVDDKDNTSRFGGVARFTLGVLENLEAGFNINYLSYEDSDLIQNDTNFGDIELGVKFRFLDQKDNMPFSLAYQGGFTIPTSGDDTPWFIEPGGLILTKNFSEQYSMDADFVFGIIENDGWSFVSEIGFGYFITPWFQPVIEGAFAYENKDNEDNESIINITAGFTAPPTDWLNIIFGVTPDVYTRNKDEEVLITMGLTFLF